MFLEELIPIFHIVGTLVCLLGLIPALYLLVLGLAGLLPSRKRALDDSVPTKRITVLIPAHNERMMIAQTVAGALEQDYPKDHYQVMVIADNCSDETADLARGAGARVLERSSNPGKGQALHEAMGILLEEDWDGILIVDADTVMHPQLLRRLSLALSEGEKVVQVTYGVLNPEETWRTAAMELALASFNGLRPLGKARMGHSSGLFGNGFMLSREALEKVPYLAGSIVEDLEYHIHLLKGGFKAAFCDDVWVKAQMPATAADSKSQRVRWERGRLSMVKEWVPPLFKDLLKGRLYALEALVDVCIPPVSVPALLLIMAVVLGPNTVRILALAGLAGLFLHYGIAALRFGSLKRFCQVLVRVPYYLVWKTWTVASSLLTHKSLPWVRTKRH